MSEFKQQKLVKKEIQKFLKKIKKIKGLEYHKILIDIFPEYTLENKVKYGGFREPTKDNFIIVAHTLNEVKQELDKEYYFYGFPTLTIK